MAARIAATTAPVEEMVGDGTLAPIDEPRDAHLTDNLSRFDGRPLDAGDEVHERQQPFRTRSESPAGLAVPTFPPTVPELRIWASR